MGAPGPCVGTGDSTKESEAFEEGNQVRRTMGGGCSAEWRARTIEAEKLVDPDWIGKSALFKKLTDAAPIRLWSGASFGAGSMWPLQQSLLTWCVVAQQLCVSLRHCAAHNIPIGAIKCAIRTAAITTRKARPMAQLYHAQTKDIPNKLANGKRGCSVLFHIV
jgi:hypothetical protein